MKSNRKKKVAISTNGMLLRLLKSSLFGCVVTIAIILLFALFLKWEILKEGSIPIATSIIKALCAGFVGLLCANGCLERAWIWAGIGGACYILFAFFAFSLVEKTFSISFALLADLGMGFVAGIAGGVLLQVKKPA